MNDEKKPDESHNFQHREPSPRSQQWEPPTKKSLPLDREPLGPEELRAKILKAIKDREARGGTGFLAEHLDPDKSSKGSGKRDR